MLEHLLDKCNKYDPSYICVAREYHKDGNAHLHAILILKVRADIRNGVKYFGYPESLGVNI